LDDGFVGGRVNTVEELVGVFVCGGFNVAFVTLGRAVAGGLVWDELFVVGGFIFASVFGWVIVGLVAFGGGFVGGMVFGGAFGRAVAGGLARDELFVVRGGISVFGWVIVGMIAFGGGFIGGTVFGGAFVALGRAVAGGLVCWDGLFVVGGFVFVSVFGRDIVGLFAFGGGFVDGMVVGGAFGRAVAGGLVQDGLFVVRMFVLVSVFVWVIVGLVAVGGDFVGGMVFVVSRIYIFGWFVVVVIAFGRILVGGCIVVVAAVWRWHRITLQIDVSCNGLFNRHHKAETFNLGSWCDSIWRTMILALAIMFLSHMGHFRACGGAMVLGRMGQRR
jgi:hypothetical protein